MIKIIRRKSSGRSCTLIGVPWRGVGFSTLSTRRFVLKQHICKGAESAKHAETAGYTYEGTQTTVWVKAVLSRSISSNKKCWGRRDQNGAKSSI